VCLAAALDEAFSMGDEVPEGHAHPYAAADHTHDVGLPTEYIDAVNTMRAQLVSLDNAAHFHTKPLANKAEVETIDAESLARDIAIRLDVEAAIDTCVSEFDYNEQVKAFHDRLDAHADSHLEYSLVGHNHIAVPVVEGTFWDRLRWLFTGRTMT